MCKVMFIRSWLLVCWVCGIESDGLTILLKTNKQVNQFLLFFPKRLFFILEVLDLIDRCNDFISISHTLS